jgi:hypothetical protein
MGNWRVQIKGDRLHVNADTLEAALAARDAALAQHHEK